MNEALNRLKSNPIPKIGLITEPPDFSFDVEFDILRKDYDFIQIPSVLGNNSIRDKFEERFPGIFGENDLDNLKLMTHYDSFCSIQLKFAEFVLTEMSNMKIWRPTVFHLPVAPIDYQNYFDVCVLLRQNGEFKENLLKEHCEEEGFPVDVELELLKTQKIYFNDILEKGIWSWKKL